MMIEDEGWKDVNFESFSTEINKIVLDINIPIFECLERRCPFLHVGEDYIEPFDHPNYRAFLSTKKHCELQAIPCPLVDYTDHVPKAIIKWDWMEGALKWIAARMVINASGFSGVSREMLEALMLIEGCLHIQIFSRKYHLKTGWAGGSGIERDFYTLT